jgi:hypothetical protein
MGRTGSTYGGTEKHRKFWSENLKGRDCWGDVGIDERITLK